MKKLSILWIISVCAFIIFTGCSSHSESPIVPGEKITDPELGADASESRALWGIWDLTFDPASMEIKVTLSREGMAHFNITSMMLPPECGDCLDFIVSSFDPATRIMGVDVTVKNPTALTGYDVRGIVYTNDFGHRVYNSDGWTDKWDVPGGGSHNPFMIIEHPPGSGIVGLYSQGYAGYDIYIPKPPHYNDITFAIDASWPAHVKEPRSVTGPNYVNIYKGIGSKAYFDVQAFDYDNDIDGVTFDTPLITGQPSIPFTYVADDTWNLELTNSAGPLPGSYDGVCKATSSNSGAKGTFHVPEIKIKKGFANTWGSGCEDIVLEATTDSSGNIFVAGFFTFAIDIDPGPGEVLLTAQGLGDAVLIKYDPNGNLEWGYSFGSDESLWNASKGTGVTTDASGNVYMTGNIHKPVDFDPGPGVDMHGKLAGGAFLVKFDAAGNYQWTEVWGKDSDYGAWSDVEAVVFDGTGSLYCVGFFDHLNIDFDPDPAGEFLLSPNGVGDAYLLKLDTNGNFVWVRAWGGAAGLTSDKAWGVDVDGAGNPILCGVVNGPLDMDPGAGEDNFLGGGSSICAYTSGGDYIWGDVGAVDHLGIAVDSAGNSYIIGQFYETKDFDPGDGVDEHTSLGTYDSCLLKFDAAGVYQWGKTWGGPGDYWESFTTGSDVSVNAAGDSIACVGGVYPIVDFDPGPGVDQHIPVGQTDAYLSVFDSSGNFQWARTFGGLRTEIGLSVTYDFENNIVMTGGFGGLVDFDPGPGKELHQGTGHEWFLDSFVCKFPPDGDW